MHLLIGLVSGLTAFAAKAMASDPTLPIAATDPAVRWDDLYHFLVALSVFFFVLVVGAMIYFVVKFRSSKNPRTKYITGNHMLEAAWIAVPTILLMIIFGWGYWVYRDMVQAPTDAYEIRVVGKQWSWTFLYDSHDPTTGVLYVPINRPVKMIITSEDVLHSFFIPNFRVKQDAVPGMFTSVWFEAKIPGVHQIFCAEYCGGSHSGMLAKLVALTDEQWKAFTQGATPDPSMFPIAGQPGSEKVAVIAPAKDALSTSQASPERAAATISSAPSAGGMRTLVEKGKLVFEQKGCVSCHNPAGNDQAVAPIGPTPRGLFMSQVELQDGKSVQADENYIRESIEKPQAKLVKGYSAVMPTFKGLINEQEMAAVISYIKSLGSTAADSPRSARGGETVRVKE